MPTLGGDNVFALVVQTEEKERNEKEGVIESPDDVGPVRAVPKSAESEDDERVAHRLPLAVAAAAEGDIDVVHKPRVERDVPATPELGDVTGEVGDVEVAHETHAEEFRRTDGDVGVAREVTVDLKREEQGADNQFSTAFGGIVRKNLVAGGGASVGDDHLFEKSPKNLAHAINGERIVKLARFQELRQEVRGALNRTCHKLREEGDESKESDDVTCRFQLAAVDIYGVAQRLERVERNTHRQNDVQRSEIQLDTKSGERFNELRSKEVIVFHHAENGDVDGDVGAGNDLPPFLRVVKALQENAAGEAAERGEKNEQQEAPVPPAVEHVACHDHEEVLPPQRFENVPVEQKNNGKENQKFERVEKHDCSLSNLWDIVLENQRCVRQ